MPATRGNANPASRAQAPKPSKKPRARARKQGRNRLNADDIPNETLPNEEARPNEEEVREEGGDMQLENAADTHDTTRALEALQAALAQAQAEKAALQNELDAARERGTRGQEESLRQQQIPRPKGTAGRHIHELTLNARINWEVPWAQIPAQDKVSLYQVARERHPILGQYVNDWATEELVKQYIKNKRKHAYAKRYIDVPDKYNYLKHNASKRSTAPRASRAKFGTVTSSAGRG